jgi:hypothetical protein
LPPLPDHQVHRPPGRSIIDVLDHEHSQVAELCAELRSTEVPTRRRQKVADVVVAELARHMSAERQYLYPTVRALLPDGEQLADAQTDADTVLLQALKQLQGMPVDDPRFATLAGEVADQVERHQHAAVDRIFDPLREAATDEDLIRLGNRVEMVKEAAPTRAHPAAPARPPWNAVVDPALGVIDKARDAVTRRTTYVGDLPDA